MIMAGVPAMTLHRLSTGSDHYFVLLIEQHHEEK